MTKKITTFYCAWCNRHKKLEYLGHKASQGRSKCTKCMKAAANVTT